MTVEPPSSGPRPPTPAYLVWVAWVSVFAGIGAASILIYEVSRSGRPGMLTGVYVGSVMIGLLVVQAITSVVYSVRTEWRRPNRGWRLLLLVIPLLVFLLLFAAVRIW